MCLSVGKQTLVIIIIVTYRVSRAVTIYSISGDSCGNCGHPPHPDPDRHPRHQDQVQIRQDCQQLGRGQPRQLHRWQQGGWEAADESLQIIQVRHGARQEKCGEIRWWLWVRVWVLISFVWKNPGPRRLRDGVTRLLLRLRAGWARPRVTETSVWSRDQLDTLPGQELWGECHLTTAYFVFIHPFCKKNPLSLLYI